MEEDSEILAITEDGSARIVMASGPFPILHLSPNSWPLGEGIN